ncbi:MAG TPA: hypothetical protein VMZ53_03680 [Kofleriaceae bacterium]|nr:hypothetical protein [Kofleriaceae bacterium]
MLNLSDKKVTRAQLVTEIEELRTRESLAREARQHLQNAIDEADAKIANLEHKCAVLDTDVHNMLGTIRVMADASRAVRIRAKSVQCADLAIALPMRNTDTL